MRVLAILADATNVIAEGEVLQLMNMRDADARRSAPTCDVIERKTAKLFEAAARLGARARRGAHADVRGGARALRHASRHRVPDHRRRARLLRATRREIGKNLGDDLREGKMTLPLIRALGVGTPERARRDPPRDRAGGGLTDFATGRRRAARAPARSTYARERAAGRKRSAPRQRVAGCPLRPYRRKSATIDDFRGATRRTDSRAPTAAVLRQIGV